MIQTIADVESHCFLQTHLFHLKETLLLCIAEEANLCQIKVKTIRSYHNNLMVAGSNFYVYATYSLQLGWVVRTACCREGDDTSKSLANLRYIGEKGLHQKWFYAPYRIVEMLFHLI
jgi:hypothetical protein